MSANDVWRVHIDGAARGNPGPAAFAFVLDPPDGDSIEENGCLGSTTNNIAEYTALVRALERAAELKAPRLLIHSDSELLVKQMNGEYRVKNENLKALYDEAQALCRRFQAWTLQHVPRAQNKDADRLCNEALDGMVRPSERMLESEAASAGAAKRAVPTPAVKAPNIDEAAVICLRQAAERWARGRADDPDPREVWKQLQEILRGKRG